MAFESSDFDPEFAGPVAWAVMYRGLGWQVVPALTPREDVNFKRPVIEWREFENTLAPPTLFDKWYGDAGQFSRRENMGVIAGKASGDLVVIDLDIGEGKDGHGWWRDLLVVHNNGLPIETPTQRTGGGGTQMVFRCPPGWTPPTFKTRIGIDIRGQGGFAMLPPSKHSSGHDYEWLLGYEPWAVEVVVLPVWACAAIDALREEYARHAGQGIERVEVGQTLDDFGQVVDGREERMANIIWGVACDLRRKLGDVLPVDNPEVATERERAWGLYTYECHTRLKQPGVTNEEGLEREGRGRTAFMDRWNRALAQWDTKLAREAAQPKPSLPPKSELIPAGSRGLDPWTKHALPEFPVDLLPPTPQAFIDYTCASIGAATTGVAASMLAVLSSALDQRNRLRLRRSGDWYAPPRIWVVLIGQSATKKTPIINACVKPLRRIEGEYAREYARDLARWEAMDKADRGAKPPDPTRYVLNDATIEAASHILARQKRGILVEHDELSGFIGSFDRYASSDAASRSFWLKAHSGTSQTVDRMSRGAIHLEEPYVSFIAAMQPARLKAFGDLTSDGLMQRFNPFMIERGPKSAEVESELPAMRYSDMVTFLAHMKPIAYQMTTAGLAEAEKFRDELYDYERQSEGINAGFSTWLGKVDGTHGSLSLLLHILENKDEAPYMQVSAETVQRASLIIGEFFIPHCRAFYQDSGEREAETERLQRIASFILTDDRDRYTRSDLRYNVTPLSEAPNEWAFLNMLAPLVSAGWLLEDGKAWIVRDGLREQFADRREQELQRKSKIRSRLNGKNEETHGDQP